MFDFGVETIIFRQIPLGGPDIYIEPWHGISNNVVCATSKVSDQPALTRRLIGAFASPLNIL